MANLHVTETTDGLILEKKYESGAERELKLHKKRNLDSHIHNIGTRVFLIKSKALYFNKCK